MTKKRKISEENRAFFKLGVLEGEQRMRKALADLKTVNRELCDIVMEMDKNQPVVGVMLDFKLARRVVKQCKIGRKNPPLANKIQEKIDDSQDIANANVLKAITNLGSF